MRYVIYTLIFFLVSCSKNFILYKVNKDNIDLPNECNNLVEQINFNWEVNNKNKIYRCKNSKFITDLILIYFIKSDCIKQLDKNQIRHLFGEPSIVVNEEFRYYLVHDCLKNTKDCEYLLFNFNEFGYVNKVDLSGKIITQDN